VSSQLTDSTAKTPDRGEVGGIYFTNLFANFGEATADNPRSMTVAFCYAPLDESVGYTVGHGLFFVDGKEIRKAPRLARLCRACANATVA